MAPHLADGYHGVAEPVKLRLGLALGGLDHQRACNTKEGGVLLVSSHTLLPCRWAQSPACLQGKEKKGSAEGVTGIVP